MDELVSVLVTVINNSRITSMESHELWFDTTQVCEAINGDFYPPCTSVSYKD